MQANIRRTALVITCIILAACTEKRGGGSFGSQVIPDEFPYQMCYLVRGDTYVGTFDRATARPQFVILWKARRAGSSTFAGNNRVSEIHDHKINVSFSEKAVYALQEDYSLKRIPLSTAENDQILESFMKSGEGAIKFNDLWRKSVIPALSIVEDPTWNPPPIPSKPETKKS